MSEPRDPDPNPLREGLSRRKNPDPATIVLFGATGDLTRRKLVPALFNLKRNGLLPGKCAIIGFARREKTDEAFRAEMLVGVREHGALGEAGGEAGAGAERVWEEFAASLFYHASTFEDLEGYRALGRKLEEVERRLGLPPNRLFYLATGPEHFSPIVKLLHEAGLTRGGAERGRGWARVVVEKPFGRDLASAQALNRELLAVLDESQVFRIDHYLGKETVQNLLALRFANGIFEPLWNQKYVDHVQITVAETVGVEGRGGYYNGAGALRDMVANHLLQVLALTAMEPPVEVGADAIRDEKVKVLRSLRRIDPDNVDRFAVRGQYGAGTILGHAAPAYAEEEGVPRDSRTETYVALRVEIENWRWAGTPFFLRTGKRLPKRSTEVCIQFRKPPLHLFGGEEACQAAPNALIVNVQPDEGISLRFGAKAPGPDIEVRQVKMDFRYGTSFGTPSPDAYERLLIDALAGDSTLFTRRDEVEAAWTFVSDILAGWERSRLPAHSYAAGTWGPEEASRLFHGAAGSWRRL
jgi:glucose-6-phosphate 1-dehydrogenase